MVDNRPDIRPSVRTALARVKGLGAAGHGSSEWWLHRVTAVANVPLVIAFLALVAVTAGKPYPEAVRIVSHPLWAIILILAILSVTNHMRMGLLTVIEDYVHGKGTKIVAVVANTFFAAVIAVASLWAIVRISLAG